MIKFVVNGKQAYSEQPGDTHCCGWSGTSSG